MSIESTDLESARSRLENRRELEEDIEEYVDRFEDNVYFSVDIVENGESYVEIDVYGVEGHRLPSKRTVANGVGEILDWEPEYRKRDETDAKYSMKVIDLENTEAPI